MALGMTKTLVKSLFSKPATLMYPRTPAKKFPATRGRLQNDISRCILCGMCQRKCPAVAIQVDRAARKWELDVFRCVSCGCCVDVCPVKCLKLDNDYTAPTTEHGMKVSLLKELPAAAQAAAQPAQVEKPVHAPAKKRKAAMKRVNRVSLKRISSRKPPKRKPARRAESKVKKKKRQLPWPQ